MYVRTGQPVATLGTERTFYHGNARLFEFDSNGKFVKEIGRNTYAFDYAQRVCIDPQDNIWAVDAGSSMAMKFDPEGRLLMVLGRKNENIGVRPGPGIPARSIRSATDPGGAAAKRGAASNPPGIRNSRRGFGNRQTLRLIETAMCISPMEWATTIASQNSTAKVTGWPAGGRRDRAWSIQQNHGGCCG